MQISDLQMISAQHSGASLVLSENEFDFFCFCFTQPSEEEEVVDLLLSNIFSLIGIRYKDKKDTMTDSSSFALNNTKEITKSP